MFFQSKKKDRMGWFYSDSSVRSNLDRNVFCDIEINLPPLEIQKKFSDVCVALMHFRGLHLKLSEICPILIKGSLDEGKMC